MELGNDSTHAAQISLPLPSLGSPEVRTEPTPTTPTRAVNNHHHHNEETAVTLIGSVNGNHTGNQHNDYNHHDEEHYNDSPVDDPSIISSPTSVTSANQACSDHHHRHHHHHHHHHHHGACNSNGKKVTETNTRDTTEESALLKSLEAIASLAAMDFTEYQDHLVHNRLASIRFPSTSSSSAIVTMQQLSQSIHKLQSMVLNLTQENDHQTAEVLHLQQELTETHRRNKELEKAVETLYNRNSKLQQRLQKSRDKQNIARQLVEKVQQRVQSKRNKELEEERDFWKVAAQVQHHEQVFRERADSNFSDIDGLQDFHDTSSIGSGASAQSYVTDEGVASLRIARERTNTWPELPKANSHGSSSDESKSSAPASASKPKPASQRASSANDGNPLAVFFAPKGQSQPQSYTLSLYAPVGLQFCKFEITPEHTDGITTTDNPATVKLSTSDDQHEQQQHVQEEENPTTPATKEFAFAVCGYHGFDATVNVRPTLGARLLSINRVAVDTQWHTDQLISELEARVVSKSSSHMVQLTFRNDQWNKEQKNILTMAIEQNNRINGCDTALPHQQFQNQLMGFFKFNPSTASPFKIQRTRSSSKDSSLGEEKTIDEATSTATEDMTSAQATTKSTSDGSKRISMPQFWVMPPTTNSGSSSSPVLPPPEEKIALGENLDESHFTFVPNETITVTASEETGDNLGPKNLGEAMKSALTLSPVRPKSSSSTTTTTTTNLGAASSTASSTATSSVDGAVNGSATSLSSNNANAFKESMKSMGKMFAFR